MLAKWTDLQIVESIVLALKEDALAFMQDAAGHINAIVWGRYMEIDRHKSCLHIICIAGFPGCLRSFVQHLKTNLPHVKTLQAERSGNKVKFNVDDIYGR